jgi:alpha-beta hydrolase superfamily lysophospholipase
MIATALLTLTLWHGCVHAPAKHGFFKTSDGVRIAYAELGSGPRGVVLAHQYRGDLCNWASFGEGLARRGYHVIVFDFRNNGLSGTAEYPKSTHLSTDVVGAAQLLRRHGAKHVVTVGASMGGTLALVGAAELYPGLVTGAISLGAVGSWVQDDAVAALGASQLPVLLTVAAHDALDLAPVARQLYKASKSRDKRLLVIPGRAHGIETLTSVKLRNAMYAFLQRHL